jgi:hypothetical protein
VLIALQQASTEMTKSEVVIPIVIKISDTILKSANRLMNGSFPRQIGSPWTLLQRTKNIRLIIEGSVR